MLLDSDIVFSDESSKQFKLIGKDSNKYFNGIFDGQGYTISNLTVTSSGRYAGLFGLTYRLTIKNVVIDDSCSVASSNKAGTYAFIGGILGRCDPRDGLCDIENSVNMARVTFNGNMTNNLYVVSIIGCICPLNQGGAIIKNCVNYGTITNTGTTTNTYIGGIVGEIWGESVVSIFIQNCANYGAINNNGTSGGLYMGGIIGISWDTTFENCLSAGKLTSSRLGIYIGSIVGTIEGKLITTIDNCYWTSDTRINKLLGFKYNWIPLIETNSSMNELDDELMSELNEYAEMKAGNWSKWMALHLNGGKIEDIAQETIIVTQRAFPKPRREGNTFAFWCNSAGRTEEYDPVRDEGVEVLYAGWSPNNYTVTFDVNGGDELATPTKEVTFDRLYCPLPTPHKAGYGFVGWFSENNESVTSETKVTIPNNHTLHARWERSSIYVEIAFTTKDITEEEVKEIINSYVDGENFADAKIEKDNTGQIKVIVKLDDPEKASNFVETIRDSSDKEAKKIKTIGFATNYAVSFSTPFYPMNILFGFLML